MFQVKYHYKKPIDHAAVNSAKLMTKTTNVILGPVTGSGCFCSHFRGVHTQFGQQHVPHLEIKQRSLQYHPLSRSLSFSVVANTFSDVNRCQITLQLGQWASLHDCIVCFC